MSGAFDGLGEKIISESSAAGAEEINSCSESIRLKYLSRFQTHRNNLNNCYNNYGQELKSIESVLSGLKRNDQFNKYLEKYKDIIAYPSGKGGGDIAPIDENAKQILKAKAEAWDQQKIKSTGQEIQQLKISQDLKRVSLAAMADVYALKGEVTGIIEKFAFIYQGSSGNMETVTVPISDFFSSTLDMDSIFDLQTSGDSVNNWTLRFNKEYIIKNSIFSQLAKSSSSEVLDFGKEGLLAYQEARQLMAPTQILPISKLTKKERDNLTQYESYTGDKVKQKYNLQGIYRKSTTYYVIDTRKKYETGFLGQSMLNAFINEDEFKYEKDQIDWYMGEDINLANSNIGYSVKNFLSAAPSLLSMNSLSVALSKIILVLNQKQDLSTISNNLRNYVFSAGQKIEHLANQELNKLPLIGSLF